MSGPEGKYIDKVHRQIDKLFSPDNYRMSNTNPYIGGIPDIYYEGRFGCLWVEYKYLEKLPKILDLIDPKKKLLTANQIKWLRRGNSNHGNVAVILGTATGEGIWFKNLSWEVQHSSKTLIPKLMTPKEMASKIVSHI